MDDIVTQHVNQTCLRFNLALYYNPSYVLIAHILKFQLSRATEINDQFAPSTN